MTASAGTTLHALAAQPDAGHLQGVSLRLTGGLLAVELATAGIFADGFESGDTSAWSATEGGRHE